MWKVKVESQREERLLQVVVRENLQGSMPTSEDFSTFSPRVSKGLAIANSPPAAERRRVTTNGGSYISGMKMLS
jgi:hypothetical protein